MELTQRQVEALALTLNAIRDDWPVPSLRALIAKHRTQPSFPDLMIAAVTKAREPSCGTPMPIFQPGPHWPEPVRDQIPAGPRCPDHPEEEARNCRGCLADVKAGERAPGDVGRGLAGKIAPPPTGWRTWQHEKENT